MITVDNIYMIIFMFLFKSWIITSV